MRVTIVISAPIAAAAVVALVALGCDSGEGTDKAGGSGTPVTLRLATPDRAGLPGTRAIERFRAEVGELSDGAIRIKPVYEAAGNVPRFDQAVVDLVRSGRAEMALVPARAWDEYGVASLNALHAPFLIRDQAVLEDVVTGELAQLMMQELRQIGVTGLGLLPENLRHPFGFTHPLVSLRDFDGVRIRAPRSQANYELLRALGAEPVDLAGDELTEAIETGSVAAAESAFEIAEATLPRLGIATSNITFFPKVNVLVFNSRELGGLTDEQRATLNTAAERTLTWVLDEMPSERVAAQAYCREGGRVTAASRANVKALEQAAQPRYEELERDPQSRDFIARIRALPQHAAAATAPTCGPSGADQGQPSTEGRSSKVLDGIYRNQITVEEMVAAGVNEADAHDNAGVHTLKLSNGRLRDTQIPEVAGVEGGPADATYRLSGHTFTFTWNPDSGATGNFAATWSLGSGELRLSKFRCTEPACGLVDRVLWSLKPFRKIG